MNPRLLVQAMACVLTSIGCASARPHPTPRASAVGRWTVPAGVADSVSSVTLAPGVLLHHLVRSAAPLRIEVLDVDLAGCVTPRAVKGAPTAVGRSTTSALLAGMPSRDVPLAAVNADFFSFTPDGVPVNALVADGVVYSGPVNRPVLAFDAANHPTIGMFTSGGSIMARGVSIPIGSWNRPTTQPVGIVDARWGQVLDTLSRPGAWQLIPVDVAAHRYRVATLPSYHPGLARGDTLMLLQADRASIFVGDTVTVRPSLRPFFPVTAVGGQPVLVKDSVIAADIDRNGAASFRDVNPRTAVGIGANGRRLLLVVIDGRRAGYSRGTTTRETAEILRDLGARDAINLDGGGSSALAVRDPATGAVRVVNRPSDATGERPVADILAIAGRCAGR